MRVTVRVLTVTNIFPFALSSALHVHRGQKRHVGTSGELHVGCSSSKHMLRSVC